MAKPPTIPLDPQTARCLKELREVIRAIEADEVGLRRYADVLSDESDGLHREIAIRTTFIPARKS